MVVLARRSAAATLDDVVVEMHQITRDLQAEYPVENRDLGVLVVVAVTTSTWAPSSETVSGGVTGAPSRVAASSTRLSSRAPQLAVISP